MTLDSYKPHGRLVNCEVPKAGKTLMNLIFGYLGNPKDCKHFFEENSNLQTWGTLDFAKCQTGIQRWKIGDISKSADEDWKLFAIVREPINRFLSAWLDICVSRFKKNGNVRVWKFRRDGNTLTNLVLLLFLVFATGHRNYR